MEEALKVTRFDGICLYFVIVGTEQLKVWEGNKHSLEIRLLPHVTTGEEVNMNIDGYTYRTSILLIGTINLTD